MVSEEFVMTASIFSSLVKLSVWVFLSAGLILYNKYILSQMGFPFPVSLTLWHQLFCTCLVWTMRALNISDAKSANISSEDYLKRVVPVGLIFAVVLWFGNAAYLYLSVSFIQMTKAFMPALVYFVGMCFGQQTLSLPKILNLFIVVIGTLIASYGEMAFVLQGFVFLLASLVLEAVRICLLQILLQKPELKLNPVQTMMYVSPVTAAALSAVAFSIEGPQVLNARTAFTGAALGAIFLTNAVCAFALNFIMFKVIKDLDGLTVNVAGVVKDCLLIGLSYVLFHSPVTWIQLLGYAIALGGVFKYNLDMLRIKTSYVFFDKCLVLPKNVFGTTYMLIIIACVCVLAVIFSRQAEGAVADILVPRSQIFFHGEAPAVKIIVNSQQSDVAREFLLKSLLEYRVNDITDIIFVVGGEYSTYDRRGHGRMRNIRWVGVEYNAIDFNGLIWASENLGEKDWFLYVHDTVRFGQNFRRILQGLSMATNKMLYSISMNMGTYLVHDLKRTKIRAKLVELKDSREPIAVKKKQAIIEEDVVFKMLASPVIGGNDTRHVVAGPSDVYGTGTQRITEYYANLDLYKFKANWGQLDVKEGVVELNIKRRNRNLLTP